MLIVVLILCVVTSVFVSFRRRDLLSLYLLGMSASNSLMLGGIIIYIAQVGGPASHNLAFLFLSTSLQKWLHYLPISMGALGYVVAVGRILFPYFLLLAGLELTMMPWVRRRLRMLKYLAAIIPVTSLVYYMPAVFRMVVRNRFWLLTPTVRGSMIWIGIYITASFILLIHEYRSITIKFFRRSLATLLLSAFGITALYLLFAVKDPVQIYNMFIGEYIRLGFSSYLSPSFPMMGWLILSMCTVLFVCLGSYGMVCFAQLDYAENREEISLKRKFDSAGAGVSVFVHGIKNQLLSSRVLYKKLNRALEAAEPDLSEIRVYAGQLQELNDGMLARMDELYRTVKNSALSLFPVHLHEITDSAVERFHGKFPDIPVKVELKSDRLVLADTGPLSEAVYNLLTNGCEAAQQLGRTPELTIITSAERLWTVIMVRDNGGGIPSNVQNRIYDPFFTSKNTNYNWGMGLFYVRRIVKNHLGRIRLESCPGKGSTFLILLPRFESIGESPKGE